MIFFKVLTHYLLVKSTAISKLMKKHTCNKKKYYQQTELSKKKYKKSIKQHFHFEHPKYASQTKVIQKQLKFFNKRGFNIRPDPKSTDRIRTSYIKGSTPCYQNFRKLDFLVVLRGIRYKRENGSWAHFILYYEKINMAIYKPIRKHKKSFEDCYTFENFKMQFNSLNNITCCSLA